MVLDGHLRESVWKDADVASDFWMSFPIDGERAAEEDRTEVRMCYDDKFIYVAAVCFDNDNYIIQTLKRDAFSFWRGDAFSLVLDPINEKTNAFSFGVNPANVQTEAIISGNTGRRGDRSSRNPSIRGINSAWDNKWFSAVKTHSDRWVVEIAIPFKSLRYDEDKRTWGVNFLRGEPETNSFHTWSPVPVQFVGVDLGFTGALNWEESPRKAKSNISVIPYTLGSYFRDIEENADRELDFSVGGDAKVAITSSLNLDITINPDFSQVEVDQQVTNLTAFNIRFPERRLFFLENSDIFSDFGIPPMRPFFSRKIGLDEDGNTIPILYGLRLSGNVNKNFRVGLMNMHTKEVDDNPSQNYTSLAFHQRVFKRSVFKGYYHSRQAMGGAESQEDNFNRNVGMEFAYQSPDGRWRSFAGYGLSLTGGVTANENNFFNVAVGYDGRNFSFYTNVAGVGNNYYADMGFIPLIDHYDAVRDTTIHVGFLHSFSRAAYTFFPKSKNSKIISHIFSGRNILDFTNSGELFINWSEFSYNINFRNTAAFIVEYSSNLTKLLFPFGFTDGEPLPAGRYNYNSIAARFRTDARKLFSLGASFQYGSFYNGTRTEYGLLLNYRTQPWGTFGTTFQLNTLEFPEPYGSQDLFLIGPRIEINFSRNLFWTTFLQYNTQRDNFNINSRLQWRFQPMSDLFLVYTDNYALEYWGPKNRAFVIKLNYWLNL